MDRQRKIETALNILGNTNLLTLLFIILKLTKVITWSWVWVTAPTWIPAALGVGLFVLVLLLVFIGAIGIFIVYRIRR